MITAQTSKHILTFAMDREQFRSKRERFKRDMHRLSEEKTRQLFEKEEDRETWVKVIRNSVEKEIESRVRQALGTPPKERQRKRLEEISAKRLTEIEEEKRAIASSILNSRGSLAKRTSEKGEELLWLRRQKYLAKFNRRRTMRAETRPNFNRTTIDSQDAKDSASKPSPIVWKSCETICTDSSDPKTQFKRGFGSQFENGLLVLGPCFPAGRLPCMATPKHLQSIPSFVENLNTPGELLGVRFCETHDRR